LLTRVSEAMVGCLSNAAILDSKDNTPMIKLKAKQKYIVFAKNNYVCIKKKSTEEIYNTKKNAIYILPLKEGGLMYTKDRWYRGSFKLVAKGDCITVVNVVNLEDYLKSVVPSEMPASWAEEALKAQSIAARSYAISNINKRNSEGYDLKDTPQDQCYKGYIKETSKATKVINETKGLVLVSNNKVIPAYYHSSSGGVTDNNVWGNKVNFVKPVNGFDAESPKNNWSKEIPLNKANKVLSSGGTNIGNLISIIPVEQSNYGRIKKLKIIGSTGSTTISVERFQNLLNLPSNLFRAFVSGEKLLINGKGSGHGLGMSQWGAKHLAERGCNAYQILGYFYTNVEIRKINDTKI
ncbi:MAG: SpoIID/LytB domain-containing protein, partial [Vampirovibrionia bacterium]